MRQVDSDDPRSAAPVEGRRMTQRVLEQAEDSLQAIHDWRPFVGGRWMLLGHVERNGRRFVLAVESEPSDRRAPLSRRERDVVGRMLGGQTDKVIACELGLAPSTVRVLMARAMIKLGARTRTDLRAIAGRLRDDRAPELQSRLAAALAKPQPP